MPLDTRKVAHAAANREKIRAGRTESIVLVAVNAGATTYTLVAGCVWHEVGAVPAGVASRASEITRTAYDALAELPGGTVLPNGLRLVARTGTASAAGVAAADRFTVLDRRRMGLGGNRWVMRLRRIR